MASLAQTGIDSKFESRMCEMHEGVQLAGLKKIVAISLLLNQNLMSLLLVTMVMTSGTVLKSHAAN